MLHRARKVFDPGDPPDAHHSCILQNDGIILLNPDRLWTDTSQFKVHLRAAEQRISKEQSSQALDEYDKAFALYQGDFLPDDIYQDWAAPLRDSLRDRCFRALETAAALAEKSGDSGRALQCHEKLFHLDTCNEQSCCWLMLRYQSDGKRSDAIRAYERCERALANVMDMEPAEETKKVYRSIIEG
jgi:DNA-binding SARP family transcriptional activator